MLLKKRKITSHTVCKYSGLVIVAELCCFIPFLILLFIKPEIFQLLKGNPIWLFGGMGASFNFLECSVVYDSILLKILAFIPVLVKLFSATLIFKKKKNGAIVAGVVYLLDFIAVLIRVLSNGIQINNLTTLEIFLSFFLCMVPAVISTVLFETFFHFEREKDFKSLPIHKQKRIYIILNLYVVALFVVAISSFVFVFYN